MKYIAEYCGLRKGDRVKITGKNGHIFGVVSVVGCACCDGEGVWDYDERAKSGEPMDEWEEPDLINVESVGVISLTQINGKWQRVDELRSLEDCEVEKIVEAVKEMA